MSERLQNIWINHCYYLDAVRVWLTLYKRQFFLNAPIMSMVINNTYDYNQNGQTVENQLYYTNDLRLLQYKASVFIRF